MPGPSEIERESWDDPEYTPSVEEILANVKDAYEHPGTEELLEDIELAGRFKVQTLLDGDFLKVLAKEFHSLAREKGFWEHEGQEGNTDIPLGDQWYYENPSIIPEKLALIHSEVSEVLDAWRDDNYAKMEEESADVLIRLLDLAEFLGFDLDKAVAAKHAKNTGRPYLHGRVR